MDTNHNLTPAEQFQVLKERREAAKKERRRQQTAAKIALKNETLDCSSSSSSRNTSACSSTTANKDAVVIIKEEDEEQEELEEDEEDEEQEEQMKLPQSPKRAKFPKSDDQFHKRLDELKAYKRKHGDLKVKWSVDKSLQQYCFKMRKLRKNGKLQVERIEALDKIGFDWYLKSITSNLDDCLQKLKAFKQEHGHTRVPSKGVDICLWKQCYKLRKLREEGKLEENKIRALDGIGFDWTLAPYKTNGRNSFNERLEKLKAYKRQHGHLKVKEPKDRWLRTFVYQMKKSRKDGQLEAAKIQALDEVGIEWALSNLQRKSFDERLEELKAYKRRYGHLRVSRAVDLSLYHYTQHVRKSRKHGKLEAERIETLDKLGFDWTISPNESNNKRKTFDERLEELKVYKQQHGHFRISPTKNASLYSYFQYIRKTRKHGKLEARKIQALDELGYCHDEQLG